MKLLSVRLESLIRSKKNFDNICAHIKNRPLAELAAGEQMLEDSGAQNRSVLNVHEDSSTESPTQLSAAVELCTRYNDVERTAAIKAFEMCYELCWKVMRIVLEKEGKQIAYFKDTFRQAAVHKLIDDPELWFDFATKRNLAVHAYKEEVAQLVATVFYRFSVEVDILIARIKDLIMTGVIDDDI